MISDNKIFDIARNCKTTPCCCFLFNHIFQITSPYFRTKVNITVSFYCYKLLFLIDVTGPIDGNASQERALTILSADEIQPSKFEWVNPSPPASKRGSRESSSTPGWPSYALETYANLYFNHQKCWWGVAFLVNMLSSRKKMSQNTCENFHFWHLTALGGGKSGNDFSNAFIRIGSTSLGVRSMCCIPKGTEVCNRIDTGSPSVKLIILSLLLLKHRE